jgi:DNA-binding MarR family transcriptional regulator
MAKMNSSSNFTNAGQSFGPPLIGALLRRPWEAVQRHMLERLHERGFTDFDAAYLQICRYPGPQGLRPSEVAAQLGMSKQAVNYLLGELERRGYLERRADPQEDGRSRRVWLTARGVEAVGVIREAVSEMETAWSQQLGEQRFARLRTLLVDLNKLT